MRYLASGTRGGTVARGAFFWVVCASYGDFTLRACICASLGLVGIRVIAVPAARWLEDLEHGFPRRERKRRSSDA